MKNSLFALCALVPIISMAASAYASQPKTDDYTPCLKLSVGQSARLQLFPIGGRPGIQVKTIDTRATLLREREALTVTFDTEEPRWNDRKSKDKVDDEKQLLEMDRLEVQLAPYGDARCYRFILASSGCAGEAGPNDDWNWSCTGLETSVKNHGGGWYGHLRIPLSAFPGHAEKMRINFMRHRELYGTNDYHHAYHWCRDSGYVELLPRATCDTPRMTVGLAASTDAVLPRAGYVVKPAESCSLRLARHERESVQVLVQGNVDLTDASIEISDLRGDGIWPFANTFARENISCSVIGYVKAHFKKDSKWTFYSGRNRQTNVAPFYKREYLDYRGQTVWLPDPILDFQHTADVARSDVQAFWVRVSCPDDQPAGVYRGTIKVSAKAPGGQVLAKEIPLTLRVNDFAVPAAPPLPLAITFSPGTNPADDKEPKSVGDELRKDPEGPIRLANGRIDDWANFLADYYITIDSLYTHSNVYWKALLKLRDEKRLGLFNLGYWGHVYDGAEGERIWRESTLPRLRANYEKAKRLGLLDHAYIYGCDELSRKLFGGVRKGAEILKREFPGVPIFTTCTDYTYGCDSELSVLDWFCPLTCFYDRVQATRARAQGRQVWWYICCGPDAPWANMFTQCPPVDARSLMGAQSVRERPDGFLYYQTTIWNAKRPITQGPFTDWNPRTYQTLIGDGCWTAVGPKGMPLATLRLENFRDGLEDYAYAMLLEKKVKANPSHPLAARARELLAVPASVMEGMDNYSDDPTAIYAWRDEMADIIEQM